jgi:hypothetical protein
VVLRDLSPGPKHEAEYPLPSGAYHRIIFEDDVLLAEEVITWKKKQKACSIVYNASLIPITVT